MWHRFVKRDRRARYRDLGQVSRRADAQAFRMGLPRLFHTPTGSRRDHARWICAFATLAAVGGSACAPFDDPDVAYVDEAIVAIVGSWDCRHLAGRASSEMESTWTSEQMAALCASGSAELGQLRAYRGSHNTTRVTLDSDGDRVVLGSYMAKAEFEKGSAIIEVIAVRRGSLWRIREFRVTSGSERNPRS
jgi:hypothetical protein